MPSQISRIWIEPSQKDVISILGKCSSLFYSPEIVQTNNSAVVLSKANLIRYISSMDFSDRKLCIRNIIINYLINCQHQCKGSEIWFPQFVLHDPVLLKNFRLSSQEAIKETLEIVSNERARKILSLVPKLMGSSGRIVTEITKQSQDIMEITKGYSLPLTLDQRFANQIGTSNIFLDSAKVLVIEGSPKNVAELNKFLEWSHKNKESVLLIARSFPEEVISTLAVNWLKKTLSIIPLRYGDLVENINAHADISAVSGSVPITPMKGDTLNCDLEERLGKISNVNISAATTIFSGTKSPARLLDSLFEKLKNQNLSDQDHVQIYTDRISGLSNELLSIKLKETPDAFLVKEELDIGLSYYNHLCYQASVIMMNNKKFIIPNLVYTTTKQMSESFVDQINSIGGYLACPIG